MDDREPVKGLALESVGIRYGAPLNTQHNTFQQAEAFLNWDLAWRPSLGKGWWIESQLQSTAGWLNQEVNGGVFSLGPALLVRKEHFPLSLDCGISPAMLTRHDYPQKDFGIYFQFISHAGLNWDISRRIRIGYRFQHMSNAHLGTPNSPLNLQMVALSYRFR